MDFNKDEILVILAALRVYKSQLRDLTHDPIYENASAKGKADLDAQAREAENMIRRIQYKLLYDIGGEK